MASAKESLADLPSLRGVVFDGSNVIAAVGRGHRGLESLDEALQWFRDRWPQLPQMVFLDAATAWRLRPEQRETVRVRCIDVTPGRARWAVCPMDDEADAHVLEFAREHAALVVSNDRFDDYDELRSGVITVQFRFRDGEFEPSDDATWFRVPGSGHRVALADLAM